MDNYHRKLILAPMAGITEPVFRGICRQEGADIVMSEMVSAEALCRGSEKTRELLAFTVGERPIGIQLFGADPSRCARAAQLVQDLVQPDFIDLNSGCPVPKVVRKNGGSALLRDPALFRAILEAMVRAVSVPVTVKIRSGWGEKDIVDVAFARIAQDCGVSAITIHPRTKSMGFGGHSYWERIALVKESVDIPVIGNGDVVDGESGAAMFFQTGCDAVMIGRGALGNPWIFGRVKACIDGRPEAETALERRRETALLHIARYREMHGEPRCARDMKKHVAWYLKGLPGSSKARRKIHAANSSPELEHIVAMYFAQR